MAIKNAFLFSLNFSIKNNIERWKSFCMILIREQFYSLKIESVHQNSFWFWYGRFVVALSLVCDSIFNRHFRKKYFAHHFLHFPNGFSAKKYHRWIKCTFGRILVIFSREKLVIISVKMDFFHFFIWKINVLSIHYT